MVYLGVCCVSLKDNKALMKMGLGLVLVGHVNFLLGALVHGAVLRHINVHAQARTMVYATSNIIAIVAGLMGIIGGITAIVLSKNKRNRILIWVLLVFGLLAGLLAVASTLALSVSIVKAIIDKGKGLLTHCEASAKDIDSSSITYECPFDPTRIYATTIILWVPLIFMSVVETVFSFRCFAACTSFLYLCPCRRRPVQARRVRIQRRIETPTPAPAPEIDAEADNTDAEPVEQDELLDGSTGVVQSEWL
ncbi:transmembrane protein 54a [Hippoglossus hippoglossus]|uniref:transmembrane protein 54a n=1 Tax=Hippoglossus hippoglossus TaxID=8267 RepID=UPI00148C97DC|nr:transmembrane protein 54a [Hippoglossus hippoglossus]